jgi:hypothetical protein
VFTNDYFKGQTSFVGGKFKNSVPDFRGATFHEATEWDDVEWPSPPKTKKEARQQLYAYQRLKQEMEKLKKHEDELKFFTKELRAARQRYGSVLRFRDKKRLLKLSKRVDGGGTRPFIKLLCAIPSPSWILNWLYEKSCDYGQSISKPVLWLFCLFVLSALLLTLSLGLGSALGLSFANIFSFLQLRRDFFGDAVNQFSAWVKFINAIESIAAAILFFLISIGLRNRFRMK